MATDLERAFAALSSKASAYSLTWRYYDGDQPLHAVIEEITTVTFQSNPGRELSKWKR